MEMTTLKRLLDIEDILALLCPREEQILKMRRDGGTYFEIGTVLTLSGERVRQIANGAIENIERFCKKKNIAIKHND
jgi:DNA-directed RNA polymerase sigma subunit (sigma70/sigma32)